MRDFTLNERDKSSLIEILLIVGTLLSALSLPLNLIWIFVFFIICAILYFIFLKSKERDDILINWMALFSSLFFSGIISYELGFGLALVFGSKYLILAQIMAIVYYLFLSFVLFKALGMNNIFYRKREKKIKKRIDKKKIKKWEDDPSFVKM